MPPVTPVPVQHLLIRAGAARRTAIDAALGNLLGSLVDRITTVLDRLNRPGFPGESVT
jgi:hypothetical protein